MIRTFVFVLFLLPSSLSWAQQFLIPISQEKNSFIYSQIKKLFFDVDKYLVNNPHSPVFFKKCWLIANKELITEHTTDVGHCLYKNFILKQMPSMKTEIHTYLIVKSNKKSLPATIFWEPVKISNHIIELKKSFPYYDWVIDDFILFHNIKISLAEPLLLSELGFLKNIFYLDKDFSILEILIEPTFTKKENDYQKLYKITLSNKNERKVINFITNYTLKDKESFINFKVQNE